MDKENQNGVDKVQEWLEKTKNGTDLSLLGPGLAELFEDSTVDRNDKRFLSIFGQALVQLSDSKRAQLFQMATLKGFFQNTARFWMMWSKELNGAEKIQKLEDGLTKVTNPSERANLAEFLRRCPKQPAARKYTMKDVMYWNDIQKYCVGIVRPNVAAGVQERVMYRYHDIYDRRGQEESSLQEMKARKWQREAEENDLKARLSHLEMLHSSKTVETDIPANVSILSNAPVVSASVHTKEPVKVHVPLFADEVDDSLDLLEKSSPKNSLVEGEPVASFTPKRVAPEYFPSPKRSISILTPLKDPAIKRDSSHLTPLAIRHPRTQQLTHEKPTNTPTAVINDVNDLVKDMFGSTKIFHADQTQFGDDTPQRAPTKTFLNVFDQHESPDPEPAFKGKARFSIFNDDSSVASGGESPGNGTRFTVDKDEENTLCLMDIKSPEPTSFDLSLVSEQGQPGQITENLKSDNTMKYSEFDAVGVQSTMRITGGSDAKSDAWITRSTEEPSSEGASDYHNPWSSEFVRIQLGQLGTNVDQNTEAFHMEPMFSVNDRLYTHDSEIGQGNFATVYLCRNMESEQYAVKLQKKSEPWEWVILNETMRRVKNTSIKTAISDAIDYCHYGNGCGLLITSFYPSGTLLELCGFVRPFLVKRSPQMKAFTLFYSAQVSLKINSESQRFWMKIEILSKIDNFGQKLKMLSKIEILIKN